MPPWGIRFIAIVIVGLCLFLQFKVCGGWFTIIGIFLSPVVGLTHLVAHSIKLGVGAREWLEYRQGRFDRAATLWPKGCAPPASGSPIIARISKSDYRRALIAFRGALPLAQLGRADEARQAYADGIKHLGLRRRRRIRAILERSMSVGISPKFTAARRNRSSSPRASLSREVRPKRIVPCSPFGRE